MYRLNLAAEWAASAWQRLQLELPVDLNSVRKHLKLRLRMADLGECAGTLLHCPKRHYVVINSRHPLEKQRFTIAHEIGEFLLYSHEIVHGRKYVQGDLKERFCDCFAVNLLMPENVVRDAALRIFHDKAKNNKTAALAHQFQVSQQAMNRRLWELGVNKRRYRHVDSVIPAAFHAHLDAFKAELLAEIMKQKRMVIVLADCAPTT